MDTPKSRVVSLAYPAFAWMVSAANPRFGVEADNLLEAMKLAHITSGRRTPIVMQASVYWLETYSPPAELMAGMERVCAFVIDPFAGGQAYEFIPRHDLPNNVFVFIYPLIG